MLAEMAVRTLRAGDRFSLLTPALGGIRMRRQFAFVPTLLLAACGGADRDAGQVSGDPSSSVKQYTIDTFLGTTSYGGASFSPDGQSLVFGSQSAGSIQRVAISGGAPQPVTSISAAEVGGLHWGDDGNVVFALSGGRGLYRVPATGGDAQTLLESSIQVRNPRLLPGGSAVIFTDPPSLSTHLFDLETDSTHVT